MAGEMEIDMDRVAVLSIGTGSAIRDLRKGMLKSGGRGWGMLEWILPNEGNIVTTIMDGSSEASQAIVDIFFKVECPVILLGSVPKLLQCIQAQVDTRLDSATVLVTYQTWLLHHKQDQVYYTGS